jgi:hypothetical protein
VKLEKRRLWILLGLAVALLGFAVVARKVIRRGRLPSISLLPKADTGPRVAKPIEVADVLYEQQLANGWEDWGWGPHKIGKGPAEITFAGYGGWLLHHQAVPWRYGGISFRFKAPQAFGEFLQVNLRIAGTPDDTFPIVPIEARHIAVVDGWSEVLVDWKEVNPERKAFDSVLIGSRTQVGSEPVSIDRVVLTKLPASDKQQGKLSVLCDAPGHTINELVYGGSSGNWSSGQSAQRMGGNPLSRANWELAVWNAGKDWFFENGSQSKNIFQNLEDAAEAKHSVALVVPMVGWVSKDGTSFSFPRSKYPPQQKYDPHKPDAGNGVGTDGKPLTPGDPSQTSIPAPPELINAWVRRVVEADKKRGWRSVHMYILDNEPTLWNETHRDVHPNPLSYDELLDRTIKYASAIRDADPEAVIAGPAEWGFTGYQYSAVDRDAGFALRPDRRAHGDVPLVAWYLKKLAEYERANNKRLLDVFDLHFYPAADGVYSGGLTDPAGADLRVRSTRALWDPTYVDESWIKETLRLIPRMKDWVNENYPGRKLVIGEWSFGADGHISGGVATAEALGRFGQQGLDAAFQWGDLMPGTATYWAFRAFRNFDGQGGRFQDVSVPTKEIEGVSLFASRDHAKTRLVLVLVNRAQGLEVTANIALKGCGRAVSSRLFSYGADSKELTPGSATITENALKATLAPFSFSVLDVQLEP